MATESSFYASLLLRSALHPLRSRLRFRFRVAMQMQFEQIVSRADQHPFAGDQILASESKPANAAYFFDLSEDRFDRRFS